MCIQQLIAIIVSDEGYMPNGYSAPENFSFKSGNYSTIKAKWDRGELPKIMIEYFDEYGPTYIHRAPSNVVTFDGENFILCFIK